MPTPAVLWIVATPIGNRGDLGGRAAEVLASVAVIAAEDTRHSAALLRDAGIDTPLRSMHEHNEAQRIDPFIQRLAHGESIAVISDAGTPLISDPGFALVRAARAAGIEVRAVPGPCAAVAALSIAGLASDRFVFEGFLPAKAGARRNRLTALVAETRTLIFYESSHRIAGTAADIAAVFGPERSLFLARELTKRHEQSVRLAAGALAAWLAEDANRRRGEFVLVVAGAAPSRERIDQAVSLDQLLAELLAITGTRQAAKIAARLTGVTRNEAYTRALELA